MSGTARRPVIAVFGGGNPDKDTRDLAFELGRKLGEYGAVLMCGGRGGVMEAAAHGMRVAGGKSIGVMPFDANAGKKPNEYIDFAIYTGMNDGRNFLMAHVPDAAVAMAGEAGTLSEVALALKLGTPLVYLRAWSFLNDHELPRTPFATTAEDAVALAYTALTLQPGGTVTARLRLPTVNDQTRNLADLERQVLAWS